MTSTMHRSETVMSIGSTYSTEGEETQQEINMENIFLEELHEAETANRAGNDVFGEKNRVKLAPGVPDPFSVPRASRSATPKPGPPASSRSHTETPMFLRPASNDETPTKARRKSVSTPLRDTAVTPATSSHRPGRRSSLANSSKYEAVPAPQDRRVIDRGTSNLHTAPSPAFVQKLAKPQDTPSKAVEPETKTLGVSSKGPAMRFKDPYGKVSAQTSDAPCNPDAVETGALEAKMDSLHIQPSKQETKIRDLNAELEELKTVFADLRKRNKALELQNNQDKADAKAQAATYRQNLLFKDQEIADLKAEYQGELTALRTERDAACREVKEALKTSEAKSSRQQVLHQQEMVKVISEAAKAAQEATRERASIVGRKEKELQDYRNQIKTLNLHNSTVRDKLESATLGQELAVKAVKTQAQEHAAQLSRLQAELNASKEETHALRSDVHNVNTERDALKQQVEAGASFERNLQFHEHRMQTLRHEVDSLRGQVTSLTSERDLAVSLSKTAEEEAANWKTQAQAAKLEFKAVQITLDASQAERNNLFARVDDISTKAAEDAEAARKQIEDLQRCNEGLQAIARRTRELQEEALAYSPAYPALDA